MDVDKRVFAFQVIELGARIAVHGAKVTVDGITHSLDTQSLSEKHQTEGQQGSAYDPTKKSSSTSCRQLIPSQKI